MRHALNFQLGLHARGPGRDSYKGVDEWKTPASVSLDRSLIRAAPSHKVLANFGAVFRSSSSTTDDADDFYGNAASHAATTVLGVFLALPLAIYAHARITARIAATRAPYAVRLALTVLAFVACVTAASLLCFEACRAPCRAWVGVGCLRA